MGMWVCSRVLHLPNPGTLAHLSTSQGAAALSTLKRDRVPQGRDSACSLAKALPLPDETRDHKQQLL